MKERNCVDKYRSKCKTTRRRFHGYKAEKVTTTTTQSESMHMQDGEEPILGFWKKQRNDFVEDIENLNTINKIVPIAANSNFSQGSSISGVVSHKMKKERGPKGIMINLLAQGYKIIDSNILQSMLKSKLQIRENVNKLVMRENIVLFCLRSPQVEGDDGH